MDGRYQLLTCVYRVMCCPFAKQIKNTHTLMYCYYYYYYFINAGFLDTFQLVITDDHFWTAFF